MTNKSIRHRKILYYIIIFIVLIGLFGMSYNFFMKKAYPIKYVNLVNNYSKEYNVEPALIYAIIKTESNFNVNAESHAGAIGLMQIMPNTFYWLQSYTNENIDEQLLKNPEVNIKYGTYFIKMLLDKYGLDSVALCAYNAGIGNTDKWLNDPSISKDGKTLDLVPYKETQQYLKRVLKNREIYRNLYFK